MMNRQLRRAQEKKDRQKEREKVRAKTVRRAKAVRRREKRREKPRTSESQPKARKSQPGRFSGAFTIATAFFIVLQALVPVSSERGGFSLVVEVLYYLLFGYFAATWLMRRGQPRAFGYAAAAGVVLALGLQLLRLLSGPGLDAVLLLAALPAAVVGAWLGRFVYLRAP